MVEAPRDPWRRHEVGRARESYRNEGARSGRPASSDVADVRHFDWERVYDAEAYIDLLETFSGHIAMQQWQRGPTLRRDPPATRQRTAGTAPTGWGAALHIAGRRD